MGPSDFLADLEAALRARNEAYADAWKEYLRSTDGVDAVSAWSTFWQAMGDADRRFDAAQAGAIEHHKDERPPAADADAAAAAYESGYHDADTGPGPSPRDRFHAA